MNTDDDDPDWEQLAEDGEKDEKKRELFLRVADAHTKTMTAPPLEISKQKVGTRLVVIFCAEDIPPVEFTILDPERGKVLVQDGRNFTEPTEGTLLGSEDLEAITPGTMMPCKRVLLPGKVKLLCWLAYEVNGRKYDARSSTIREVKIFRPGETEPIFTLWSD